MSNNVSKELLEELHDALRRLPENLTCIYKLDDTTFEIWVFHPSRSTNIIKVSLEGNELVVAGASDLVSNLMALGDFPLFNAVTAKLKSLYDVDITEDAGVVSRKKISDEDIEEDDVLTKLCDAVSSVVTVSNMIELLSLVSNVGGKTA